MVEIETVFSWLKRFRASRLVTPATTLRDQITDRIRTGDFIRTYKLIEYLETSAVALNDKFDTGDISAEIGLAFYQMGNLQKAEEYWLKARADYNDCHEGAIISWLLGAVRWQIDIRNRFALNDCKTAIREFRDLANKAERDRLEDAYNWYEARIPELEKYLAEQISIKFP